MTDAHREPTCSHSNLTCFPKIDLLPLQSHHCLISVCRAWGNAGTGDSMVAVSGTQGKGWGDEPGGMHSHSQAVREGSSARNPNLTASVTSPPHAIGLNPSWLAPSRSQYLAAHAELADTGLVCSLGDSLPQISGRDQDICLQLLFISIQT